MVAAGPVHHPLYLPIACGVRLLGTLLQCIHNCLYRSTSRLCGTKRGPSSNLILTPTAGQQHTGQKLSAVL